MIFITWIKPTNDEAELESVEIVKAEFRAAVVASDLRAEAAAVGPILVHVPEVK
jgi:hypothetical protein